MNTPTNVVGEKQTLIEWTDDMVTRDRIIKIRIAKGDMLKAKFDQFDRALFDDIENGEPSNTPIADRLLGLETLVRRIEESKTRPKKGNSK